MSAWNGIYTNGERLGPDGRILMEPCPRCEERLGPGEVDEDCALCDGDGEIPA
jgi:hypothetical protein